MTFRNEFPNGGLDLGYNPIIDKLYPLLWGLYHLLIDPRGAFTFIYLGNLSHRT
mgnify:CR=1 FL=1